MYMKDTGEYYNPIDLNHIFEDDDILDDWIRETEEPALEDDLTWLDEGIRDNNAGRRGATQEEEAEDDTPIPSSPK